MNLYVRYGMSVRLCVLDSLVCKFIKIVQLLLNFHSWTFACSMGNKFSQGEQITSQGEQITSQFSEIDFDSELSNKIVMKSLCKV